jgi:hypothetical protein
MEEVVILATQADILASLALTGGILDDAKVHLYKTAVIPTVESVLGDFTEADYTGYAAQTVASWGNPFQDIDGKVKMVGPTQQYQPTATTVTNTIYGYYVTNAGSTVLIYAKQLDQPIALVTTITALLLTPEFGWPVA